MLEVHACQLSDKGRLRGIAKPPTKSDPNKMKFGVFDHGANMRRLNEVAYLTSVGIIGKGVVS